MTAAISASTPAEVRNLASARTPHILARGVALDFAHSGQRQRVLADIDLAELVIGEVPADPANWFAYTNAKWGTAK